MLCKTIYIMFKKNYVAPDLISFYQFIFIVILRIVKQYQLTVFGIDLD